jgi:hypothetical protein
MSWVAVSASMPVHSYKKARRYSYMIFYFVSGSHQITARLAAVMFLVSSVLNANAAGPDNENTRQQESPWLLTPTISSDPKLGSSFGLLGAYLKKYDEVSPASMFGVMGSYSDTDSYFYGTFARSYFDHDRQRVTAAYMKGKVNNNYEDFLGSGLPVSTTDDLDMAAVRYLRLYKNNWYLGLQFVSTNYAIIADDALSGAILELLGLTGFKSNALGVVANYDTRDNQNSPASGSSFLFHNLAYSKSLGGDVSFDAYVLNYSVYLAHGNGHVAALHAKGRWTDNAPASGYSTIELRGYTRGEYLAPHMSLIEFDERIKIKPRWGVALSSGIAYLYGGKVEDQDDTDWYPAASAGIMFTIKPEEKMVVRADYAIGKSDNSAFYLSFGQPF